MKKSKHYDKFFTLFKPELQIELYGWQRAEFDSLAGSIIERAKIPDCNNMPVEKVAFCGAYGTGKTTVLALVCLFHILYHWAKYPLESYNCVILSGTDAQLKSVLWETIRRFASSFRKEIIEMHKFKIGIKTDKNFNIFSKTFNARNPQALAGVHATNLLVVFDEGTAIDEDAYKKVENFFTNCRGTWVLSGNPTEVGNMFYRAMTNSNYGWKQVWIKRADLYPESRDEFTKQVIEQYGRDSSEYRIGVLGQFPDSYESSIFPMFLLEMARDRQRFHGWHIAGEKEKLVFGIDVATGESADYSAIVIRNQYEVLAVVQKKIRYVQLVEAVKSLVIKYRPVAIAIDEVGVGHGLVCQLQNDLYGRTVVLGVNGAKKSRSSTVKSLRCQLYLDARHWLADVGKIPDDEAFITQLRGIETDDGINVNPKKRTMKSPDMVDAFCYSFAVQNYLLKSY